MRGENVVGWMTMDDIEDDMMSQYLSLGIELATIWRKGWVVGQLMRLSLHIHSSFMNHEEEAAHD